MVSAPRKRDLSSAPKIRRGPIGTISQEEADWVREEIRKRREKYPKGVKDFPIFGRKGKSQKVQASHVQPQRGWTAQPAENQQQIKTAQLPRQIIPQSEQPPVEDWWRKLVFIIMAILALMMLYAIFANIFSGFDGGGGSGFGCPTTCEGYAVLQPPGCGCPPGSSLSTTTPYAYNGPGCEEGCAQCIC